MRDTILTFKRYEKKYLLSAEAFARLWDKLGGRLEEDEYPRSTVCSLYYDSGDFSLIRRSLERPVYKEKLRLRSYGVPDAAGEVFVELKKKYKGVVYKRRAALPASAAEDWLAGKIPAPGDSQTLREIAWFLRENDVQPRVFIACDREAWRVKDQPELRITFDRNLRWRGDALSLTAGDGGEALLAPGEVLMEIKIPDAAPLWLAHLLSEEKIFPVSFSKYGTCYREHILCTLFSDPESREALTAATD